jgi:anthranilate phosphoribosyltransferase
VEENVARTREFLEGARGAIFDTVCANAALALMVAGETDELKEGFQRASACVLDGRAASALDRLVAVSNS